MPKYPNPEKLPKHQFPRTILNSLAENSQNGSFFLICKDDTGNFVVVPNFNNEPDKWAFYSFMMTYCQTMLENQAISLDNALSEDMFGDDD